MSLNYSVHQHCTSCQGRQFVPLAAEYAHAYLVRCSNCQLVFCSRIPTQEELTAHYQKYRRGGSLSPVTVKRYEELLEKFEPFRQTGNLLDVGCGDGHFLFIAKQKGWNVFGTEFSDEAITVCKSKGIEMYQGILQHYQSTQPFDVITSFEVLEHINDGKEHIAKIQSLLRKDGLFYFTTPNFDAYSRQKLGGKWNIIEYPEHITYYNTKTIHYLLSRSGFEKISLRTTGYSPQRAEISSGTAVQEAPSDEALRQRIEKSVFLKLAKAAVNFILNLTRKGDTLKGFYRKK